MNKKKINKTGVVIGYYFNRNKSDFNIHENTMCYFYF